MNLFPFLVLGLLNGIIVGLAAGLVARGLAAGDGSVRFRDTALLGMLGSLVGTFVATVLNAQGDYVTGGPSALLFSVVGAALTIGGFTLSLLPRTAASSEPGADRLSEP